MSATVISDPMALSATESQPVAAAKMAAQIEIESAKCDCCGLTEECTLGYIDRIRERYHGKWICGLCSEAVKDEMVRFERLISTEEALNRHMNFCKNFKSESPPSDPTAHLISSIRQILRRSLDSPRLLRSIPSSPRIRDGEMDGVLRTRSESSIPTLSLVDSSSYHINSKSKKEDNE